MGYPPPRRHDRIIQHHRRDTQVCEERNPCPEENRNQADIDLIQETQVEALLSDGRAGDDHVLVSCDSTRFCDGLSHAAGSHERKWNAGPWPSFWHRMTDHHHRAADRVLAALHGWLAPLPPEGASAIVFRDVDHAPELAAAQGIRSADLMRNGIVDAIVPELPDAADEPMEFTQRLSATIANELHGLRAIPVEQRLDARLARYRRIGL